MDARGAFKVGYLELHVVANLKVYTRRKVDCSHDRTLPHVFTRIGAFHDVKDSNTAQSGCLFGRYVRPLGVKILFISRSGILRAIETVVRVGSDIETCPDVGVALEIRTGMDNRVDLRMQGNLVTGRIIPFVTYLLDR